MTVVFLIKLELEFDFIKSNAHHVPVDKNGFILFLAASDF